MKPRLKSLLIFLALGCTGIASAVEYSTVEVAGNKITVCKVDVKKEALQVWHRDETGAPLRRFDRLAEWLESRGQKLVFAMNAGMYHGNFSAVGLVVREGKEETPINLSPGEGNFFLKPNGVFVLTTTGAQVLESSEYLQLKGSVRYATQSGPLLLHRGKMHPAFRAGSNNRLYRNGVGVKSPEIALFAISEEPVNFHEFTTLFRDVLKCQDALFLDGTISSLYAPPLKRNDFRMELGPIIGVTEPR